jgi:hypothetical protein
MKSLTRMEMTNTLDDKARQKRHKREKATIQHLVDKVHEDKPAEGRLQNPTTDSGLPVEEQLRKEWDPKKGGLPTFWREMSGSQLRPQAVSVALRRTMA